ncbi:hypothetical protein LB504_012467, partial [Fusarium proliferatum]
MSTSHPAVELMFVNITRPQDIKDRKTQRRINSHVMKPIGITRRRARPDDKTESTLKSVKSLSQAPGVTCKGSSASSNTSSPGIKTPETSWAFEYRHSLNLVPSLCPHQKPSRYPISARTSSMLHFLAVEQEAPVCKLMRELCFALALADDSAMHLALARLEIGPERTGGWASEESASSLTHYNASIEILRNQLGAQLVAHEAIIGVVVNLACYDIFTNNLTRWKTHMSGLQKMIEYRGGINTLSSQYLQVTAIWMDLTGSMILDQPPHIKLYQAELEDGIMDVVQKSHRDIEVLLELLLKLANLAMGQSELELSQNAALLAELQDA